jgi:2-C-methyl-D-erythritol 4-phosphate cytidylyltransferase
MTASLIIPAAGRGTRLGSGIPKQLLELHGRSVLAWSLAAFAGLVDEAVVAIGDDMRITVDEIVAQARLPFPVHLVAGGTTRQRSVHAALQRASGSTILVHDSVRPLVPRVCIQACLTAVAAGGAAVVAVPCAATVKRTLAGTVVETVPREDLWLAQTPQGFLRDLGLQAFARAEREGWSCSDDAQVLERAGARVAVIPGDTRNLKITTMDDWAMAVALMRDGG